MIVESHRLYGSGLARLLEEDRRIGVATVGAGVGHAPSVCKSESIDVLITDIDVGGSSTLDLIREVTRCSPRTRVIVVAGKADWRVVPALHAGAAGFLLTESEPEPFRSAIVSVHQGEHVLCPDAVNWLLGSSPEHRLTRRERDVLQLMARGVSNREIAEVLQLGDKTVRNYVSRIYRKLDIASRADLDVAVSYFGAEDPVFATPSRAQIGNQQ